MLYQKQRQLALVLSLFLMLLSGRSVAEGTYDARFLIHSIDCENSKLFFDIQVRAAEPGSEFYLANQNYRFSFNRDALLTTSLVQELDASGFVPGTGPQGFSLYSPHNLTGSLDTVASYNIELQAGDGIYVESTDYVSIGRLCLSIVDFNVPVCMTWHTPDIFPATFVGENINGMLSMAMDGFLLNYKQDFSSACNNVPPTAVNDSASTPMEQPITICVPTNDSDTEAALDPSSVTLVSAPPASEGTVTLDAATGCITFTPAVGFSGAVTAFDYQICDEGVFIPTYQGDNNPDPLPMPDPADPDLQTQLPACTTATVNITVTSIESPSQIPTLGEWSLIILALLMSITAVAGIRARKTIEMKSSKI